MPSCVFVENFTTLTPELRQGLDRIAEATWGGKVRQEDRDELVKGLTDSFNAAYDKLATDPMLKQCDAGAFQRFRTSMPKRVADTVDALVSAKAANPATVYKPVWPGEKLDLQYHVFVRGFLGDGRDA